MLNNILSIVLPLMLKFWWVFAIAIIISICRFPIVKGWIGEVIVNFMAKISLSKNTYHLIKNVTIPTDDGTTQIDHIIVSKYGIFVIETKNYKGWIFGSEKQRQWTQQIYKVKNKFQNPLRQNYKHTKTLEKLLGITPYKIFSVIVFIGNSTFKTPMPENVTKGIGYVRYIKSKKDLLFSEEEVANMISKISSDRLRPSLKTHIKHASHVKEIIKSKEYDHSRFMPDNNSFNDFETGTQNELIQEKHDEYSIHLPTGICPKCSVGMGIIYGKYGYYWKCPSCHFTESIKVTCPNCKAKMKLRKDENEYFIYCNFCEIEGVYY